MKRLNVNPYAALLVLVSLAFFSACSGHDENSATSNSNAQQANSNTSPQPEIAQSNPPPALPALPPPAPAAKASATGNPNVASTEKTSAAANGRVPKIVVSDKKFDFGKQPQGKSLVRAIVVKNGGRADLKIESVVPS